MKGQRLIAVFLLGVVLLTGPVLALFNRGTTLGGVPLLYGYLFTAWALLIALAGWIAERPDEPAADRSEA